MMEFVCVANNWHCVVVYCICLAICTCLIVNIFICVQCVGNVILLVFVEIWCAFYNNRKITVNSLVESISNFFYWFGSNRLFPFLLEVECTNSYLQLQPTNCTTLPFRNNCTMLVFASGTSLSLAYNELSIDSKKRDEKMKSLDPKKKQQMERLGMGASGSRQVIQPL